MTWCLISLAAITALAGLAALRAQIPHLQLPSAGGLLRGCVALLLLTITLGLVALALVERGLLQ